MKNKKLDLKKKINNFIKWIEYILIGLTIISLILNMFIYTNEMYNWSFDTVKLVKFLSSGAFNIILWIDNFAIYFFALIYAIEIFEEKTDIFKKICFCLFSVCTTYLVSTYIYTLIGIIFGIF